MTEPKVARCRSASRRQPRSRRRSSKPAQAVRANFDRTLPARVYRVRVLELEPRWPNAEVDEDGAFRLTDGLPADRS